jgi:polyisoprenoid-binding protein YceI
MPATAERRDMIRNLIAVMLVAAASFACAKPPEHVVKVNASAASSDPHPAGQAAGEKITITPETSKVIFTGYKVTGSEGGRFKKVSGHINLVDGDPARSRVEIEIDMDSVVTESQGLAEHLKNADFFDVPKYPQATFVSTRITKGVERGATHTVTGDLELHGVRRSITVPAKIEVTGNNVSMYTEFAIDRKDFGIVYAGRADDLIRDEVTLRITINAPRPKSA